MLYDSQAISMRTSETIQLKIFLFPLIAVLLFIPHYAFSQTFEASTDNQVYTEGQPLFVYGKAAPEEDVIVRLFAPDDTVAKFDQISTGDDGSFNELFWTWPESSTDFPFGTYTLEVISSDDPGVSQKFDLKFTSTSELKEVPVERRLTTSVFAPETAAVSQPLRVFVQTTSDGLLIGGDPDILLETSHVHLPSGRVASLSGQFETLHQGLYFVDYVPDQQGTYVFHVVTFSQGSISHGSSATNVLASDIGGISEQIIELNSVLNQTSTELDTLESEIEGFGSTLGGASEKIESSVDSISASVGNIEEASSQLNSLFFPIVASIGIIVALQIAILARSRQ